MRAVVFGLTRQTALTTFRTALRARQWEVAESSRVDELVELVRGVRPDLVVLIASAMDLSMILDCTDRVREIDRQARIFIVGGGCSFDVAIGAMRRGVNDVLPDRCSEQDIEEALARTAKPSPRSGSVPLAGAERLVGESRALAEIRQIIQRVAATDSNVLITGETGTGKELTAELIHCNSRRRDKPFVSINCAAIPDGLLESELFGYERGAFTGAYAPREGKLQFAQGGTLFLDEVGDMNLYAQAKILRAIESRKVQRLGGHRDISLNVRIIAATNHNLEQMTSQQKFRQDLFFRLNVARIHMPPLRDHAEDIPALVEYLFRDLSSRLDHPVTAIETTYVEPLLRYDWPGNVRELRNVIESTLVFCTADHVTAGDLPQYLRALFQSEERKRDSERERVRAVLISTGWNRTETARKLGCSRMTLYRKMVRYQLFKDENDDQSDLSCNAGAGA